MATTLTRTQVIGPVETPLGDKPVQGRIQFLLARADGEGTTVVAPATQEFLLDAEGDFSAQLWCTVEGERGLSYTVQLVRWDPVSNTQVTDHLGYIALFPAGSAQRLVDLLTDAAPAPTPTDLLAAINAAVTASAANATAAAGSAAAAAASAAGNLPARADLATWIAGGGVPVNGKTYFADGSMYVGRTGATTLPGLPGMEPGWPYHIQQWGVVGNASDGGATINAAITWLNANGGGVLNFDLGRYGTSVPIVFKDGVKLAGQGMGQYPGVGFITDAGFLASERTEILALSAMAAVIVAAAAPDDTLSLASIGFWDMAINCNLLADLGFDVTTMKNSYIDGIIVFRPVVRCGRLKVLAVGDEPSQNNGDNQFNGFGTQKGITGWCGNTGTAEGFHIIGTAIANTNQNIHGLWKTVTNNTVGIRLENLDNEVFTALHAFRFVPGPGIVLSGGAGNPDVSCRNVLIVRAEAANGWVLAETGSQANRILSCSTTNGASAPVIETGATLVYALDSGATEQWSSATARQAMGTSAAWVNGGNPAAFEFFARLTGVTTGKTRTAAIESWLRGGGAGAHDGEFRFVTLNNDVENTPLILSGDKITVGVGGTALGSIRWAQQAVDLPSIAPGGHHTFTIAAPGIKQYDPVFLGPPPNLIAAGLRAFAPVCSADDVVTAAVTNVSGAAVDMANLQWLLAYIVRA
jgi:hypothetical protein